MKREGIGFVSGVPCIGGTSMVRESLAGFLVVLLLSSAHSLPCSCVDVEKGRSSGLGRKMGMLILWTSRLRAIAWNPPGSLIATGSSDRTLRVCEYPFSSLCCLRFQAGCWCALVVMIGPAEGCG